MVANFITQGRRIFVVPSSGVDPAILRRQATVYGGSIEDWIRYARIIMPERAAEILKDYPEVIFIRGEDWREDLEKILKISKEIIAQTGQPTLSIVGVDTLVTLYGERESETILNISATETRISETPIIFVVKAGLRDLAIKLNPIADIHLRLTERRGTFLLYGVKPRIGLYAVESDTTKGYPIPSLTSIV